MQEIENAKRAKEESSVVLSKGKNSFSYSVTDKNNIAINDANVTFLLTRPHTVKEDVFVKNISIVDGNYVVNDVNISKAGRYTLQLRAKIGNTVGYSSIPAYLQP